MKIALFGGSGAQTTGSHVLRQALDSKLKQQHTVKALVRDPTRLAVADTTPGLTVVRGDVLNKADVEKAIDADTGAVVISLGTAPGSAQPTVCSEGTRNIIEVVKAVAPRARIIAVTSMGVGDSINKVGYFVWFFVKTILSSVIPDKDLQEKIIQDSGLEWIIVRPGGLSNGPLTGKYQLGEDLKGGQVSRADVAHFILANLTGDEWKGRAPSQQY